MTEYKKIWDIPPFSLEKNQKQRLLINRLRQLTAYHKTHCKEYQKILEILELDKNGIHSCYDIPFLPVRIFKDMDLCSVPNSEIVKTLMSSGTTGQAVSKIYLNRETVMLQQKALVKIVSDFTGKSRLPMLIIDSPNVIKDRKMFSARGAGILGFSIFASERKYALNEEMQLDLNEIQSFLKKNEGKKFLMFGFTYMIWEYFYKELRNNSIKLNLKNAVMIHGGGWKKLEKEAVCTQDFKDCLRETCGLTEIYDYYGMVEQTGTIYMQCSYGHFHASNFSDIVIRRMLDFSIADIGEEGVIQVMSLLPESYPGHSILTEDVGIILGEDDCPCGRKGKYFKVLGRMKNAEVRGCSDTYEHERH